MTRRLPKKGRSRGPFGSHALNLHTLNLKVRLRVFGRKF